MEGYNDNMVLKLWMFYKQSEKLEKLRVELIKDYMKTRIEGIYIPGELD